jgi:cbb3-type cytochrome oxidase subunit 1
LTFGRLRPIHTNATFYGFASIALVGLGYYVAVRSSGAKLYSATLAWTGLVLFNLAALAGTIALDLGYIDGDLEYREWPWWIRLIFLAALVVTAWNLIGTVARRSSEDIYLSNWYIIGGTLWTCIIAVVAIVPQSVANQWGDQHRAFVLGLAAGGDGSAKESRGARALAYFIFPRRVIPRSTQHVQDTWDRFVNITNAGQRAQIDQQ